MRRKAIALAVVTVAVLAGGCGTSETKRAVDPRTEVLRYFERATAAVALVRSDRLGQLPEIEAAIGALPGYASIADLQQRAGLTGSELKELIGPRDEQGELGPPELAIGAANLVFADPLLALDTGDEERLERVFERLRSGGSVRGAGEFHEASLYAGPGVAFATRDGVLLASTDLTQVRTALEIRDGDDDLHLDDGEVGDLLDELPEEAPIQVYTETALLLSPDFALNALADRTPWLAAMDEGALAITAAGPGVVLDLFARLDRESLDEAELPASEEFADFSLSRADLTALLTTTGASQLRPTLLGMTPIEGEVSASTDELRARVELAP
jgi:hypothetical protein